MGPVEFLVLAFPGASPSAGAVRALGGLRRSGAVRVIDTLVVIKAVDGDVSTAELSEIEALRDIVQSNQFSLIDADDAEEVAETLEPGSCALLALVEQTWAADAAEAVGEAGGSMWASVRIPAEIVGEALAMMEAV